MLRQIGRQWHEHIRQYWLIYLTITSVYITGLIFGIFGVSALGGAEVTRLSQFVDALLKNQPSALDVDFLKLLARDALIVMAGIWLLGLTVVGTPLIYLIVFTRGFILGFTVSFFIAVKGVAGLILILTTVFIPAALSTPLLLLGAGLATVFSVLLLRGKARGESLSCEFFQYTATALLLACGAVLAGIAQGYFSLLGVRLFGL
ncbi:MAG: stage II sporulation protein M [Peptococcaceae bacterium]|jgi:stage II sporulation protein M|nr:stage II sporulation protein M [Peptococcaceae bacterium]